MVLWPSFPVKQKAMVWEGNGFGQLCLRYLNKLHGQREVRVFSQKQNVKINTLTELCL